MRPDTVFKEGPRQCDTISPGAIHTLSTMFLEDEEGYRSFSCQKWCGVVFFGEQVTKFLRGKAYNLAFGMMA